MPIRPTSYTEMSTFGSCRKKWQYSYVDRIAPAVEPDGLTKGKLGHRFLQMLVGLPSTQDVARLLMVEFANLDPELREAKEAVVLDIAHAVRVFSNTEYHGWWPKVLAAEYNFQFRIPGLRVPVIGFIDKIVQYPDGTKWMVEYKWVKQFRSQEQFDLDDQLLTYSVANAACNLGCSGVRVVQFGPRVKPPEALKKEGLSRKKVGDWDTYRRTIEDHGLDENDYLDMKDVLPAQKQFEEQLFYYPNTAINHQVEEISRKVRDMRKSKTPIYRCNDGIRCSYCQYRELCIEESRGGDVQQLKETLFVSKDAPETGDDL